MKTWKGYSIGLMIVAGLAPGLRAQPAAAVATNGTAAATAGPGAGPATAVAAAGPRTIFAFFGLSKDNLAACRARFCNSQLGQLLNNSVKPVSAFSGGVIPSLCPPVTAADLAKPGAEGAAAAVKLDEVQAKARRAAVRYLGTLDCHWWPDAEEGLILALRTDRNECVRYEAALALGNGCCCTKRVIEALAITVSGSNRDNNPSENSERVRAAAEGALQHCLAVYSEVVPAEPIKGPPPEGPPPERVPEPVPTPAKGTLPEPTAAVPGSGVHLAAYYKKLEDKPMAQVVQQARQALAQEHSAPTATVTLPTGARSLYQILMNAKGPMAGVVSETSIADESSTPAAPESLPIPQPQAVKPALHTVPVKQPTPVENDAAITTPATSYHAQAAPESLSAAVSPALAYHVQLAAGNQTTTVPPGSAYHTVAENHIPAPQSLKSQPAPVAEQHVMSPVQASSWHGPSATEHRQESASANQAGTTAPASSYHAQESTQSTAAVPTALAYHVQLAAANQATTGPPASTYHAVAESHAATAAQILKSRPPEVAEPQVVSAAHASSSQLPSEIEQRPATPPPAVSHAAAKAPPASAPPTPARSPAAPRAEQVVMVLRDASRPGQRLWAAETLASEFRSSPAAVPALLAAARQDIDPVVRARCVRCLAQIGLNTREVVTTLQVLRADIDPRVRQEANKALGQLANSPTTLAPARPVYVGRTY